MSSQAKMNVYMERHRIGPLFEDLMNRVLRDMPEEPMVYLLRTIYKKAGIEIPQGIRYGGLRKSTHELPRGSSPERPSRSGHVSSCADVSGSRDYDRPWAVSPTRRSKPRKAEEGSKSKPNWNADNKTKHLSSFDEFWEGSGGAQTKKETGVASASGVRKSKQGASTAANAWASVGLEDGDGHYSSPPYRVRSQPPKTRMTEEELLASEMISPARGSKSHDMKKNCTEGLNIASSSARDRKGQIKKHRQQLGEMLTQSGDASNDSGLGSDLGCGAIQVDDEEDQDAIELLENAEDLRREGVVNISRSGYKLSRNLRHRENEPRVKLNINVNPDSFNSWQDAPRQSNTMETPRSSPDQNEFDEEEEFESVSQVTGPRQPVWKLPGGEGDSKPGTSIPLRPGLSDHLPSQHHKGLSDRSMHASAPGRTVRNAEDLSATAKTWSEGANRVSFDESPDDPVTSRSLHSDATSGGWNIPDDTDLGSGYDWNQRVKGGPPRDPRAY